MGDYEELLIQAEKLREAIKLNKSQLNIIETKIEENNKKREADFERNKLISRINEAKNNHLISIVSIKFNTYGKFSTYGKVCAYALTSNDDVIFSTSRKSGNFQAGTVEQFVKWVMDNNITVQYIRGMIFDKAY